MVYFHMLVGCPASGKSTWAELSKNKAVVVSSDAIRGELYGDESVQKDHQRVFSIAKERIINALNQGKDVIFDATNITYKNRKNIMSEVNKFEDVFKFCDIFAEPIEVLLERNANRERKVPEEVIERMMRNFEMPVYTEGFDVINIHNENKISTEPLWDIASNFDQKNHHHSLSLYDHCTRARSWIVEHVRIENWYELQNLADAALFHDLGKIDTQTFFNSKGIETEEAHYYGHNNLGAYYALLYDEPWENPDRVYIAQLICYHMQPYLNKTAVAERRWRERLGSDLWDDILIIHEADIAAH